MLNDFNYWLQLKRTRLLRWDRPKGDLDGLFYIKQQKTWYLCQKCQLKSPGTKVYHVSRKCHSISVPSVFGHQSSTTLIASLFD